MEGESAVSAGLVQYLPGHSRISARISESLFENPIHS